MLKRLSALIIASAALVGALEDPAHSSPIEETAIMTPQDADHIRTLEADNRNLRDTLRQMEAWVQHWRDDVSANLKPTTVSLEHALGLCATALQKEPQS